MLNILPTLGIFAMASYKLLPVFQQVYGNLAHIRGAIFGDVLSSLYKKMGFEPLIMFSNEADIFTDQIPIILIITLLVSIYPFMKILFTNISKSIRD